MRPYTSRDGLINVAMRDGNASTTAFITVAGEAIMPTSPPPLMPGPPLGPAPPGRAERARPRGRTVGQAFLKVPSVKYGDRPLPSSKILKSSTIRCWPSRCPVKMVFLNPNP